jgi:O-antigen ligase
MYKLNTLDLKIFIENWTIVTLTIFLLGYFFFPTSSKHNTFFYIGTCIPVLTLLPFYYKKLIPTNWLTITTFAYLFYLYINNFWSIHYDSAQSIKYLRYLGTLFCLFAAVYITHYKKPTFSILLFPAIVITGFFHYSYDIYNHLTNIPSPLATRYSDPIDSAMLAGLLCLTCAWLAIEKQSWRHKALYLFLSIPFILVMLLSKSRGPQLALILTLPLIAYYQSIPIKKLLATFIALLVLASTILLTTDISHTFFDRGTSAPYRMGIWAASLKEALDYFWFGQGVSHRPPLQTQLGPFNHSHNIFLSVFRMGGIVAALLFITQLFLCLYSAQKNRNSSHNLWVIWLVFGVFCLLTNGKYPLSRPSSAWLGYWIPIAFICASYSHFLSKNNAKKA